MENKRNVSTLTRNNWIMDASLFLTAVVAVISGIYFLFIPSGGFQGGRNPWYGVTVLLERETWEWLHTWIGLGMVVIALIHILFHWKWVVSMTKRVFSGKTSVMSGKGKYNLVLNITTGVSFLVSAISGVYFLLVGSSHGGLTPDPMFLFTRATWDVIHTWSSVLFIVAIILHFAIHWGWITKVTRRIFQRSNNKVTITSGQSIENTVNKKEFKMLKKGIGIVLLVGVIGLLAFGAITRTYANNEASIAEAAESSNGINGNGRGNGGFKDGEDTTGFGYGEGEPLIDDLPAGELNQVETDALLFMYEEEKLARDVYSTFAGLYTQPMFTNITSSEQSHMDAIKELLERYDLEQPVSDTAGVFSNPQLKDLYEKLTLAGSQSLSEALKAGAAIEEIDILDLKQRLAQTDQQDITRVFESLLAGSYNHLNAFASVYAREAGTVYVPQYMTNEEFAEFQQYLQENDFYYQGNGNGRGGKGQGGGKR